MENTFTIQSEKFQGPIELLLDLIEKRKLHVSDVSLAQVTDAYIAHIRTLPVLPIEDMANFLTIASTLLLIKSLSLLPTLPVTEEEREGIKDLEDRLRLYQEMRDRAEKIRPFFGTKFLYYREGKTAPSVTFVATPEITVANLKEGMLRALQNIPKVETLTKAVVRKIRSIEEVISDLTDRMQKGLRMRFSDFSGKGKAEKVDVILSFLAMLELVKEGIIDVTQQAHFADIEMESKETGLPRYT